MITIAHISDLHFGREDPVIAEGLVKDLHHLKPALVINSGDFTQRARQSQYQAAAAYMKHLPRPQLNVPGNHDIPLYDVARRFLDPLGRYKFHISGELLPRFMNEDLVVIGINTARSLTWKSGRISIDQINEVEKILSGLPFSLQKVVVTHHPFIPQPGYDAAKVDLVGRAGRVLEVFDNYGVDLLLAGHLHHGYTGDTRTFYPSTKRSIIVAQAGTAISKRVRNEVNSYNFIRMEPERIEIEARRWNEDQFTASWSALFELKEGQWLTKKTATVE